MGLLGVLLGLALLVWLAYRGWSILLLAPGAAQTFMDSGSRFVTQFFPLFLHRIAVMSAGTLDSCRRTARS